MRRHTCQEFSMNLERGRPVGCAFFYAGQCQADLAHRVEVNCALWHGRVRLSARTGTFSRQAIATSRTRLWLASEWGCRVGVFPEGEEDNLRLLPVCRPLVENRLCR